MKNMLIIALLILTVTLACQAETVTSRAGVKFDVPAEFTKNVETDSMISWTGPTKGEMPWSINFTVTPIPAGVSEAQMFSINFKGDRDRKTEYSSVEKLRIPNAYIAKEVKKEDKDIYHWYIKAFHNRIMFAWNFAGSYSTFKEYGPIIDKIAKSVAFTKK